MAAGEQKPVRFLIADTDTEFVEQLMDDFKGARRALGKKAITPVFSDTVRSTQSKLSDRDFDYAAIFVNPGLGTAIWMAIMRACHQYRVGVPVFVIYDDHPTITREKAEELGAAGFLAKPLLYSKMVELVTGTPVEEPEEPEEFWVPTVKLPETRNSEPEELLDEAPSGTITDKDMIEVSLINLAGRVKSAFDIYVRLSNGKYVRILKDGDMLSHDRIERYRAKGLTVMHILRSAQAAYLNFYDAMVAEVLSDKNASPEIKVNQVVAQGEAAARMLRDSGFSEKSVQQAQQYVANTTAMVSQIGNDSAIVKKLLMDIASLEHSVACTMLASLMLKHIGGANPAVFNGIGIGCFLHDIALLDQPPVVRDEVEGRMSDEQKVIYRAHPQKGAEMLAQIKTIPPMIVAAVAQHHRRMDGSGFPSGAGDDEINRVAQLIGLSEEFLKVAEMVKGTPVDPFKVLRTAAEKQFSEPVVDAFIRTFEKK